MPMITARQALHAILISTTAVLCGGTAATAAFNEEGNPGLAWIERTTPVAKSVSTSDAASFGILRRNRGITDQMPGDAAVSVGNSEISGRNVALSRAFTTPSGRRGWVIPGAGTICLAVTDEIDGYGITCQPTDAAESGGIPIMLASPEDPHTVRLSLLAPDNALVTAEYDDGSSTVLEPRADGMVAAILHGGPTVHVTTAQGSRSFKVPEGHTAFTRK